MAKKDLQWLCRNKKSGWCGVFRLRQRCDACGFARSLIRDNFSAAATPVGVGKRPSCPTGWRIHCRYHVSLMYLPARLCVSSLPVVTDTAQRLSSMSVARILGVQRGVLRRTLQEVPQQQRHRVICVHRWARASSCDRGSRRMLGRRSTACWQHGRNVLTSIHAVALTRHDVHRTPSWPVAENR